jgi:hypothetical protein
LRSFALTLHFYSPKGYKYVRKVWGNELLPHPATIRDWYKVVDGRPGFSKQAFDSVSRKIKEKDVFCNIVIDEMFIREQMIFSNHKFYGGADLGTHDV